ncbi:MAG: heat-inducible transcriptional repressor HrcA [Clostridiales bacterium]|nr:heat-inducible transcriptional repressor HrcA [Clostridiales bacterium]
MNRELKERQKAILRAVVEEYILTGEPVGSRVLARKYGFDLSPATIRNEMADLEEAGLLHQPHTSAGRVPSDAAFRYYVDRLMEPPRQDPMQEAVARRVREKAQEMGDLLRSAVRVLSETSRFLALVSQPVPDMTRIQALRLVPVAQGKAALLLTTDDGRVESSLVEVDEGMGEAWLEEISTLLHERLAGSRLGGEAQEILRYLMSQFTQYSSLLQAILALLERERREVRVHMGGATYILRLPEFRSADRAAELLETLEEPEKVAEILGPTAPYPMVRILIGGEMGLPPLWECSLVSATYRLGSGWGQVGVLGPKRMDYRRIMAIVDGVASTLTELAQNA